MKILHVITSLGDGGAEGALYRLCSHDTHNQHVVISLRDMGKYGVLLKERGIEVHCVRMHRMTLALTPILTLYKIMKSARPDLVQTWLYHADFVGGVIGRAAGIRPIIWGIRHSNLSPGTVKARTATLARICGVLSRFIPSAIISCSKVAAERHARSLGYMAAKIVVIPNGYDLQKLKPDAGARSVTRAELKLDADLPVIGMVARFDAQKDHANLVRALCELRRRKVAFNCLLVGEGVTAANRTLTGLLDAHGLRNVVQLLGPVSDIGAVMNALDLHVLSSLGEAFPNVVAEAMACGTPCVVTDVGDAAYIVGEAGWVVPPKDSMSLADGIESALTAFADSQKWMQRKESSRVRIEKYFSISRMTQAYNSLWLDQCSRSDTLL